MTSIEHFGSVTEGQELLNEVRLQKDRQMQALHDAKEKANRSMDRVHELRSRQAFRRSTEFPCTWGAC